MIERSKKSLVMITGAGASIAFGFPSTQKLTTIIDQAIRSNRILSKSEFFLYDAIVTNLKKYLRKPGILTFEDIYQGIQDVSVLQDIPGPDGFDEFRPRVGASHSLKNQYLAFSDSHEAAWLHGIYLNILLETFLNSLSLVKGLERLKRSLRSLDEKFVIHSFTLNYDPLLDNTLPQFETGFGSSTAPRNFRPKLLMSALASNSPVHCHLHGSLKWGFPTLNIPMDFHYGLPTSLNPFEIHEFDSPENGVQYSKNRPSGRPIQRGETLPPSPIITGLDKAELVFSEPFFTNFLTFFRALDLCSHMLIIGYGFSDRHVNMAIRRCRINRPDVTTYIVNKNKGNDPTSFIRRLHPTDAWLAILSCEPIQAEQITSLSEFPGWWKVPGISRGELGTSPIYLWLKGYDAFAQALVTYGLPK